MTLKLSAHLGSFEKSTQNTHVIGVFQGEGKEAKPICSEKDYAPLLAKLSAEDVFTGKKASTYFLRSFDDVNPSLLFVGAGKAAEVTGETLRSAAAHAAKKLDAEKVKEAALLLSSFHARGMKKNMSPEKIAHALAQGALFSQYTFDQYKSEKSKAHFAALLFFSGEKKGIATIAKALETATAENVALKIARDFSNEPASHFYPMEMAKQTQKLAKEYGVSCKVLDKKALAKEKMGALLGVGQGSVNPPCLIVLEYKPKKKAKKTIAFVGKAVTFDSGGISLKPGAGMEDMKHDMSGGADVIAATFLAAKLKSPNHIICVVPAAENMPDGNAIVPSAILKTRNGKTIEVQNTDAEGRLILSDALDYAQDFKPDAIIDVATLTGAVVMALSHVAAGIMGNNEELLKKFQSAAKETEERYVELPIFQEYIDDIKSKIADIKNMGSSGSGAGSQKGGAFLKEFIKDNRAWLHVDIAGTSWSSGGVAYHPKHGATGHTVRTLAQFAMDF